MIWRKLVVIERNVFARRKSEFVENYFKKKVAQRRQEF